MIIRGWSIDGYGVFHQEECRELGDGLTVLIGPNEAGKSTMMAFIRGVLFGFPDRRSRDQQYPPLRGGRHGGRLFIDRGDGSVIIEREAGRLNPPLVTLPNGDRGGQAELDELLGGLDRAVYRNIFAFGLDELNNFSALDAGGMGQRLFSAGITGAGRSARVAADTLGEQAARLLRARGRSAVGTTLHELTGLEERIAEARSELARHPGLLREEEERRQEEEKLSREVEQLRIEEKRLEQLLELWPSWNQRNQALERLALLPAREDDDPGGRLGSLVDRLEEETDGMERMDERPGKLQAMTVPVLIVLTAAGAAGLIWHLLADDWVPAALFGVGTLAAALAAMIIIGRRLIAQRHEVNERDRRSATNLAAAARDLVFLRRSLSGTAERQSLEQTVRQVDALVASRAGLDRDALAFTRELDSGAVDTWQRSLEMTRQDLAGTMEQRDQAIRRTEALHCQREELEESADLPALETEVEILRSRLEEEIGQWHLLVMARGLVETALGKYVARRQPEVLERASGLFGTVSGGKYERVVQEPEGNGLTLISTEGKRLGTGDLSRGTAEQLYLCLRLALAEDFSERGRSMPLLMDDVLVNADPQRAAGMAAAIREYAAGGQIILFTCHPGTAALFEGSGGGSAIRRLGNPDGIDHWSP